MHRRAHAPCMSFGCIQLKGRVAKASQTCLAVEFECLIRSTRCLWVLQAAVRSEQEPEGSPADARDAGQPPAEPAPVEPREVIEPRAPSSSAGLTLNWASIKVQSHNSA